MFPGPLLSYVLRYRVPYFSCARHPPHVCLGDYHAFRVFIDFIIID